MKRKLNRNLIINIVSWIMISFALTLLCEFLQRGSVEQGMQFFEEKTRLFLLNYAMFLSITSIAFIFNKTRFVYSILSFVLVCGHIISGMMTSFRGTPLVWADIYSIKSGIAIADQYIDKKTFITIFIVIIAVTFINVILWKTEKVNSKNKFFNIVGITVPLMAIIFTVSLKGYVENKGLTSVYSWDMPNTYKDNGFMYSFLYTRSGFKVDKPRDYKKEEINDILDKMQTSNSIVSIDSTRASNNSSINPNIIFIQLESFFNPYRLQGLEFETDPIPTFRELYESSPSGILNVPAYGGGTVRTEFEILTGFSTDYLPVGEIPNNNVLKKQAVESLAHILREKGYQSSALHNYHGDYYNRNVVYSNLGFDNFISKEHMPEPQDVPYQYFPEDTINLPYIQRIIDDNENPQFIYNMTMESHGSYSMEYEETISKVTGDISETEENQLQHYLRNIQSVDNYIRELLDYINSIDEPTVLVLFGDHLPSLEVLNKRSDILSSSEEMYQTEYLITDNIGLIEGNEKVELEAYQLSSYVLELLDMVQGVMPAFHEAYKDEVVYQEKFNLLQYDLLFGEKYTFDKKNPYNPTKLNLGLDHMVINEYKIEGSTMIVKGENFNYVSTVNINGKDVETIFEDESTLIVENPPEKIKEIKTVQRGVYNTILGESNVLKGN